jgi:hypothetical protein
MDSVVLAKTSILDPCYKIYEVRRRAACDRLSAVLDNYCILLEHLTQNPSLAGMAVKVWNTFPILITELTCSVILSQLIPY